MRPVQKGRFLLSFLFIGALVGIPAFASLTTGPVVEDTAKFLRNGEESKIGIALIDGQEFLGVDQMARLAGAQLRWQAVTQQACLSNLQGLLCFNWDRFQVERDGRPTRNKVPLRFEDNQLFVPLKYVLSHEFQTFSDSDIAWDPQTKQLSQMASVTLGTPAVEKLSDRYQLRIETPEKLPHYLIEKNDKRIWIRFVRANSNGSQSLEGDNVIREVRIIQRRHSSDMIVTLGDDAVSNDVYFDAGKKNLIVDVYAKDQAMNWDKPEPVSVASVPKKGKPVAIPVREVSPVPIVEETPPAPITSPSKKKSSLAATSRRGLRTIVIDAGHGGMDAGAVGARGTMEKDINLEVARALAKQLKNEGNVQIVMTRETDEFIPLNERTNIANAAKADLFVSIHCNSSLSSKSVGFETYFLSPDATDKAAEAVARLENSVVSLEAKKGAASSRLGQLLASMAVQDQINDSSRFAALLCRTVKDRTTLDKVAVKEADFFVLRGAQMPAVLVELEYLSHPVSEIKLRSSRFRSHLVKGIAEGILAFDKQVRLEKETVAAQVEKTVSKTQR